MISAGSGIQTWWKRGALAACFAGLQALAQTPSAAPGETVLLKRASELRETPAESARSLGALPAQSALTRLPERQGPWLQVRSTAGATGWVHMFDVGSPATAPASSGGNVAAGALRGLTSFFNPRSSQGTTAATSTIGIRGLGAEDLARAQPDAAAVTRMEALRIDAAQARDFAGGATLTAQNVPALPVPAKPVAAAREQMP